MTEVQRPISAAPDEVFAVLADPDTYPRWVVGAQRIRGVDGDWPEMGAAFHHVVGIVPFRHRDNTEVVAVVPNLLLALEGRARPLGRVRIEFHLRPTAEGTTVSMHERLIGGPVRLVPNAVMEPMIAARNRLTLRRLAEVVAGRR